MILRKIRDFFRGYSDEDLKNVLEKMKAANTMKPGSIIELTAGEMNAHVAWIRERYPQ